MQDIRSHFPILQEKIYGKPLVYFDNGASAQKPRSVIEAVHYYYQHQHSNVHRGVHHLSQHATQLFENTRLKLQGFINAKHAHEIIFTSGTTQSINLVAHAFREKYLKSGDEVLISAMEHHANIVPWQQACEKTGATLKVIPISEQGELIWEEFEKMLNPKVKIISITHVSNTLGTINPIKKIIQRAHEQEIPVLIDGAQAIQHMIIDVQDLDCDFYTFSGHKLFGPAGTGVLYGKEKWLKDMPVYQSGGDMIKTVSFEKTTFNELPHKFEAGTPNIEGFIGLGAAIDFLQSQNRKKLEEHEHQLLQYASQQLLSVPGARIIGQAKEKTSVLSFLIDPFHPYDIGTLLDQMGIAVRTGHHCTQPLMDFYQIPGTVRASFAFYNTLEEVDLFITALKKAAKMLG